MNTRKHPLALLAVPAVVATLALSGCGSSAHTESQTIDHAGTRLDIISNNANMPVSVVAGEPGKVTVAVTTQTALKGHRRPDLQLSGDNLKIGTPCSDAWVGYCEATFTVSVGPGSTVTLNGSPVTVR